MKIAIVSGGTGGHIYPGIAIAQEIKDRDPDAKILFLGSSEGLEKDIIAREGYPAKLIRARALLRKFSYKALSAPFISMIGFFQALRILKAFSPNFLLSTGGYASLPVVVAAKVLRISVLLHEQNVLPGIVNRFCSIFANEVFLSFAESTKYLKGKIVGNPVRREIIQVKREEARKKMNLAGNKRVILVVGGSQGSKKINQIVISSLSKLPSDLQLVHIIGSRDFGWVNRCLEGTAIDNYFPMPYLHEEMANALAAADLVVSRAGATAIAEFLSRHLPMILIPFPYAAENHQQLNAEAVAKNGAALILEEKDLTPSKFIDLIAKPAVDYVKMSKACKELATPHAAERMVNYIYA